jgi:two-component system NarL family sensor kinase
LLDIYRHESEGLALRCEPLNLVDQAHTAVATLTDLASNRDIHLKIKTEAEELWIHGDPVHLQRVFINLILNGIHHSPRGKWVTIELIQGDLEHQVQIHDRGLGLSSSELVRLFERFYQADSDRQAQGSGLGLYLSRQIIEAHGGKIWAKNDHAQGAVFCFQLPRLNLPSAERSG